ncbi:MAG: hypothetical protein N2323_07565 [candidate division WOR-3 bacterium]|nr:hypothetical protein [candidate division WOR-3 bacterium]
MKKLLILVFVPFLFVISCKNITEPSESQGILPLKVGNYWKFINLRTSEEITFRINETKLINNITWYRLDGIFATNKKDGLWIFDEGHSYLAYKYPARVGDTCNANYFLTTIVKSINDTITVPAGKFVCYRYESYRNDYPNRPLEMKEWFSPNIGPVRIISYYNNVIEEKVLKAFKVK